MWKVLRMYGVGGRLRSQVKVFYRYANACIKVNRKIVEVCTDDGKWKLNTRLFADNTVLMAEN